MDSKHKITFLFCLFLWGGLLISNKSEIIVFDHKITRQDSATSFLKIDQNPIPAIHNQSTRHHHSGSLLNRQLQEIYLLADFLFHSIGFEFLGDQTESVHLPLRTLQKAVHDSCTLQCEERSQLMIEICRRSFGIKGRLVNIPNHHSFPVFTLGKKEYIIDPYDPIYFISPIDHHILSWGELLEKKDYIMVRTSRKYGPSKELISKNLSAKLGIERSSTDQAAKHLEIKICDTLNHIKRSRNIEIPAHQDRQLHKTESQLYPWRLDLWDRQNGDAHITESYGLAKKNKQGLIYVEQ